MLTAFCQVFNMKGLFARLPHPRGFVSLPQHHDSSRRWERDQKRIAGTAAMGGDVERRRFRRAAVAVDVAIRPQEAGAARESAVTGAVKDISLAGVYCYAPSPCPLKPGAAVVCEVTVPVEHTRQFPFSRILSRGWVVRVEPVPTGRREHDLPPGDARVGIAVAFTPDVKAFGTV